MEHLWFSEKQKKVAGSYIARLGTGEEVEYTEMSDEEETSSTWDDKKYLGIGKYIRRHSKGRLLFQ